MCFLLDSRTSTSSHETEERRPGSASLGTLEAGKTISLLSFTLHKFRLDFFPLMNVIEAQQPLAIYKYFFLKLIHTFIF